MDRNEKARKNFKEKTMTRLSTPEKLEAMKKAHCAWPACKEPQVMQCSLPPHFKNEKGDLVPNGTEESHYALSVPGCMKHVHYFMSGMVVLVTDHPKGEMSNNVHFYAEVPKNNWQLIRQTETIVHAIEFELEHHRLDAKYARHHARDMHICVHCLLHVVQHDKAHAPGPASSCPGCKHLNDCYQEELNFIKTKSPESDA